MSTHEDLYDPYQYNVYKRHTSKTKQNNFYQTCTHEFYANEGNLDTNNAIYLE